MGNSSIVQWFDKTSKKVDPGVGKISEEIWNIDADTNFKNAEQAKVDAFNAAAPERARSAQDTADAELRRKLLLQGRGISATLGGGSFIGDTSRANAVSSTLGVG